MLAIPARGDLRLRSTSTARAFSGETYTILHPFFSSLTSCSISRSRHHRNAVSVLPVPVGARMRALSPRAMTGQPNLWGAVGASNTARNHSVVTGWKQAKASVSEIGLGGRKELFLLLRFLSLGLE